MKKSYEFGVKKLTDDTKQKFINEAAALMSMQAIQMIVSHQGYLSTTTFSPMNKVAEVCIHFEGKGYPKVSSAYKYTKKEVTSHEYWQSLTRSMERVRCLTYEFRW